MRKGCFLAWQGGPTAGCLPKKRNCIVGGVNAKTTKGRNDILCERAIIFAFLRSVEMLKSKLNSHLEAIQKSRIISVYCLQLAGTSFAFSPILTSFI